MDEAVRKHHLATDVTTADQNQRWPMFAHHLTLDDMRKMGVTPIVHVLVGRTGDGAPGNRLVSATSSGVFVGSGLMALTGVGAWLDLERHCPDSRLVTE